MLKTNLHIRNMWSTVFAMICTKCSKDIPESGFYKNSRKFKNPRKNKAGLMKTCKECVLNRCSEYRKANRGVVRAATAKWQKENKSKVLEKKRRWSKSPKGIYACIKKRGNCFISQEDFLNWYEDQPLECVYCGISEAIATKNPHPLNCRLNIDRKNSSRGYEKGNLVLACGECNRIKSNILSFEDMRKVGELVIKPKRIF